MKKNFRAQRNQKRIESEQVEAAIEMHIHKNGMYHPSQIKTALSDYFSVPVTRFDSDTQGWYYTLLQMVRNDT